MRGVGGGRDRRCRDRGLRSFWWSAGQSHKGKKEKGKRAAEKG